MTSEQWKRLQPGDVVIDMASTRRSRKIHKIGVVRGKHGQRGRTRYVLTVDNLKSVGGTTIIFCSDVTGPLRFELPP